MTHLEEGKPQESCAGINNVTTTIGFGTSNSISLGYGPTRPVAGLLLCTGTKSRADRSTGSSGSDVPTLVLASDADPLTPGGLLDHADPGGAATRLQVTPCLRARAERAW